jgi:DNA topoisomerase-1
MSDAEAAAHEAGLHYVSDAAPGLRRVRRGKGFSYVDADGATVHDEAVRARIGALVIPPAWTDVWICKDPRGHLQATGRDARGRKVYRYHPRWRVVRDADKYDRLAEFGDSLETIRRRVDEDSRRPTLDRVKVTALVVRLLDETLIRVGNPEYAADNDSFGLTTLRHEHVQVGTKRVAFAFVGKAGVEHEVTVDDPRLARAIRRCHELGGKSLFAYESDDGPATITSDDVNDLLREIVPGGEVTAKDFRTWGATVGTLETLATEAPAPDEAGREGQVLDAIDAAAELLGNTRTVCRSCYVHPAVPAAHLDGTLAEHWRGARSTAWYRRAERAALSLLTAS